MVIAAPAVAVGAIISALMWALLMIAGIILARVLATWFADNVPLIGGALAAPALAFASFMEGVYRATADAAITPLAHFVAAVPDQATQIVDQIILVLRSIIFAANLIGQQAIDTAGGLANAAITAALQPLWDFAHFINDVRIPNTEWFIAAVQLELWNAVNALTSRVEAAEALLGRSIDDALNGALSAVYGAIEAVRLEAWQAVQGIEAGIEARIGALGASIEARVMPLVDALARELAALRSAVEQAIPGLNVRVDEAAAAAAAAAAVAATITTTATQWIHECGEPLCTHFGPEIPFMQAFQNLLELGLVTAWVADAIAEPDAAARRTDAIVSPPLATVAGVYSSMAGG